MTINDYRLDELAAGIAAEIISECNGERDTALELAHEGADNSEWAIYYHKAHELCQNCNTENGEQFFEDCGPWEDLTYNGIASIIAYGELNARICEVITAEIYEAEAAK